MNSKVQTNNRHLFRRRNVLTFISLVALAAILFYACFEDSRKPERSVEIAVDWNKFILDAEIETEGYRGPVAARAYGYVGLAAYEAGLPGFAGEFNSLVNMYPGLKLPDPPAAEVFNIAAALNGCYHSIIRDFFLSAPEMTRAKQKRIMEKWEELLLEEMDTTRYYTSRMYGENVAKAVFAWSATDSLGYRANHHNYDRNYLPPAGDGRWVSLQDFPMPPLLPYWGKVRPFVIKTENYLANPLPPYSTSPNDIYHKQAVEILTLSQPLTAENMWIAKFWNDDRPGLTFSPAGHWLAITNQVIEKEKPSIEKTLETYLKVGFALSDAIVACWNSKYQYNMERPESFIKRHLSKDWRPYSPSPSFPSYPSGHSMMGAAAAIVLADLYGEKYSLVDRSHAELDEFDAKPRQFKSFDEMARENALSRIFLGVHWRMDCEEGLRLGDLIGEEVSKLKLEEKLTQ